MDKTAETQVEKWIANLWGFAIINDVFEVKRACICIELKQI